ncbi:MAG: glycoside hydrolase family 16 protein [Chloroflexi bacterium]|nr:glycoside hydrolase family 16 protein [Chloroflexota bacterium]
MGQLQFTDGLVVRSAQEDVALYTPTYGLFELRARAVADPANMVALWMIGYGDMPERSGEILVFEIFGRDVTTTTARIGMGVRPWADPRLRDTFEQVELAIDVREPHDYAVEWTPEAVAIYVDDRLVKVQAESPDYPMQFMLNVYEFRDGAALPSPPEAYPKAFRVDRFRAWRAAPSEVRRGR